MRTADAVVGDDVSHLAHFSAAGFGLLNRGITMATFYMHISDGKEAEVDIQADNAYEALNVGLHALR